MKKEAKATDALDLSQAELEYDEFEVESEQPIQEAPILWRYNERQPRKFGVVTKEGLIVGRGATKRIVPPDEVFKLAELGCTNLEIAKWFDMNEDTLVYNFSVYLSQGRESTKQRLRAKQLEVAMSGNPTMLIWLGKNMLGQSDNPQATDEDKILPWSDE